MATVLLIGTLDTKGPETGYLRDRIRDLGGDTLVLNSGILGEAVGCVPDFSRTEVALAAGSTIDALRNAGTRGKAVEEMLKGVRKIALDLQASGKIHGVVSLGGAEGSVIAAAAAKELPIGFPKLIVSPVASGNRKFGPLIGTKDTLVMHSIVDILGLNPISRAIYDNAAAAIHGMAVQYEKQVNQQVYQLVSTQGSTNLAQVLKKTRPSIAATMLGNTTKPLMRIRQPIEDHGYDFVIFHANGVGGRAMEELIVQGYFDGVVDYTLSELPGHLVGGFHDGGAHRLEAAASAGIPQVIVAGCLDFIVFGHRDEVPDKFKNRPTYYHNPEFTLVRVTHEEQLQATQFLIDKLNRATGPVTVLVPLDGGSVMENRKGGTFWQPETHQQMREALKHGLNSTIKYHEVDAHINDDAFADATYQELMALLTAQK